MKNEKNDWPLIGNKHIISFLSKSIINNNIANTYIFLGPDNLGKTTVANYFAKSLLCPERNNNAIPCGKCYSCNQMQKGIIEDGFSALHGDFHLIKLEEEKKNISIEQVRELIRILSMSSFLNSYKIGIIKNADRLSIEAANALLKTLEEPMGKTVIILISPNLNLLPKTISSRSQVLNFYPVKNDDIYDYLVNEYNVSRSKAIKLSRLSLGRPALAVKFLENKDFYEDYLQKVDIFLNFFHQDINIRLDNIEKIIGSGNYGQEANKEALKTIGIWQGVARDLLLLDLGHNDLIQHEVAGDKLKSMQNKIKLNGLLNLMKILRNGEKYLEVNVNPKLVLENIAINI